MKKVAFDLKMHLPIGVVQVLTDKSWQGGPLVQLEDMISRPTAADLVLNASFLKPFLRHSPDRVPSAFFVGDVMMYLDKCFIDGLLLPREEGESKRTLAAEEGKKVKALIGYLRYLWRSSTLAKRETCFFRCCWFDSVFLADLHAVPCCFVNGLGKTGAHPKVPHLLGTGSET